MLVPVLLGLDRYVITGDSMSGVYDRGSIVYEQQVAIRDLEVGDVITYTPPRGSGPEGMVTHRIVSIDKRPDRGLVFRTKGDANSSRDPWTFTLDAPVQSRVEFAIPYLGYAFAALSIREVRMAVIGLPAMLVAVALLAGLWRRAGEDLNRAHEINAASESHGAES